jgi:branched-chain amino acid aminotransferase
MATTDSINKDVHTPRIAPDVWHNGKFIAWNDARVHVMTHAIHYGSAVFEGIRCYDTKRGPAIFRLGEHIQRLLNSAKIYRMSPEWARNGEEVGTWTAEVLNNASIELVRRSGMEKCYLRPIIFRALDEEHPAFGVNPFPNPLSCYIGAWDWGKYLGDEAIEQGVDVCVSSWTRLTANTMPAIAKASSNYMNSQLIKMEAIINGFKEGIALDDRGYVSEGSGENIFMVNEGKVITPPLSSSVLPGITRDSVIQIARELGIEVEEHVIPRAALYLADELFLTGTAAEITPIRSVDRITIGTGKRGSLTKRVQDVFFAITSGEREAPGKWLTYVNEVKTEMNPSSNGHAHVSISETSETSKVIEASAVMVEQ